MPVEPRPAASVLLIRPGTRERPIEVFLIRRARDMRFLGGYYAFPGGKVDLADRSGEALGRTHGLTPEAAARAIGDAADEVPAAGLLGRGRARGLRGERRAARPGRRGAARPGRGARGAARLEAHRRALVRGERSFPAILATEGWAADLGPLAYLSHFVTPPASPIRFSARFFLCPVPAGQAPRAHRRGGIGGLWVRPVRPTGASAPGEWKMAEPAEYGTQYLAQFESVRGGLAPPRRRAPEVPRDHRPPGRRALLPLRLVDGGAAGVSDFRPATFPETTRLTPLVGPRARAEPRAHDRPGHQHLPGRRAAAPPHRHRGGRPRVRRAAPAASSTESASATCARSC